MRPRPLVGANGVPTIDAQSARFPPTNSASTSTGAPSQVSGRSPHDAGSSGLGGLDAAHEFGQRAPVPGVVTSEV